MDLYSLYEENLKIGDIFDTISDMSINDAFVLIYYKNNTLSFPRECFATLEEFRENRINQILK